MASIKDLKKRITSVKNTQQTTKAMKMVSAAKLRRAQEAITSQRPYAQRVSGMLRRVARLHPEGVQVSPLMSSHGVAPSEVESVGADNPSERVAVLVVVTSDRGLCGGFNSNVIKQAVRWVHSNKSKYGTVELAFVGRKGYESLKGRDFVIWRNFAELSGKVTFAKAKALSSALIEKFGTDGRTDVYFIYNEFRNAASQRVVVERFLPFEVHPISPPEERSTADLSDEIEMEMVIVKPSIEEFTGAVLGKNFNAQAFRILLESQAGEHGARMAAMESATKNAGEMIKKLTLQYNKQRQANITKELLEIISGSEAQKN